MENECLPGNVGGPGAGQCSRRTKWCGPGNIAANNDDLGTEVEADKCCRDHDLCPDIIPAGSTKYNLTNEAYYTRLSCECDAKFHECLHKANTKTSNTVGLVYFDVIGTQCFRQDLRVIRCRKNVNAVFYRKCVEYEYDLNSSKQYQWFDVPFY